MADLTTSYLGLNLRNPIVVSSCDISGTVNGVRQSVDAGAGAVVLKSLFEEQINAELGGSTGYAGSAFPEEAELYLTELGKKHGPQSYLNLIEGSKKIADVPVIASVNSITTRWWVDFARQIEGAGADALELNIALMPVRLSESSDDIEQKTIQIVKDVRSQVSLPIAVKIGPYFSSLPPMIDALKAAGAASVVLFNRFYHLDIDPATLKPVPGYQYSSSHELHYPLRWVSILSPRIPLDYSISTGVHTGMDVVKSIVAGANIVQIASVLYTQKIRHISTMLAELEAWMGEHNYDSVTSMRGQLEVAGHFRPGEFERLQYIAALAPS